MKLYIVSTPIGNLGDITFRAIETLKAVDVILAEDTRHSQILLKKYDIDKQVVSYHSHSGNSKLEKILDFFKEGKECALISDAGTPGISDPAYSLIQAALEIGVEIIPIPGATAILAALVPSGLPMNQFLYLGFLPIKKGRQTVLKSLADEERTVVFYESPHRIAKTLSQLEEFVGAQRKIVLARELTKIHEEFIRGTVGELNAMFKTRNPKGEFVIVLGGLNY
ncbi:16S rRNA (cytidine(1402)-2'-O)-methyltransferase [Patescibacteria group bacterium]|nr:16S rRNA (cytidine(1402)-2'-O)-methyltransferase [Patescibacteria group bacterium]